MLTKISSVRKLSKEEHKKIEDFLEELRNFYGISQEQLGSNSRYPELVRARYFILKRFTEWGYTNTIAAAAMDKSSSGMSKLVIMLNDKTRPEWDEEYERVFGK